MVDEPIYSTWYTIHIITVVVRNVSKFILKLKYKHGIRHNTDTAICY